VIPRESASLRRPRDVPSRFFAGLLHVLSGAARHHHPRAVTFNKGKGIMRTAGRNPLTLLTRIVACLWLLTGLAFGQTYPVKPIHIFVGYPAGGAADLTARTIAPRLSEHLGQPVIVDNRPGASGAIAAERVAKSPPDGYTLLTIPDAITIQPALRAKLPYNLERDLAPLTLVAIGPYVVVVHPSVPVKNVSDLLALARSRPGKLDYGSAGIGSTAHLAGALLNLLAKVDIVHVPFKGGSESVVGAASGQVDMTIASITPAQPLVTAGRLRALAVTSAKRSSLMPSVPTLDESGLRGYECVGWYGLVAPSGVSQEIISRLSTAVAKSANVPEIRQAFENQGRELHTTTPEEFAALIRRDTAKNAKLVKLTGLKRD